MTNDELVTLLDAYRDGEIAEADAARLAAAIRGGGELADRVESELEMAGLVALALDPADDESLVRGIQERFRAESQADAFVRNWQHKVAATQAPTRKSAGWMWIAATAAALLVGIAGTWMFGFAPAGEVPLARIVEVEGEAEITGASGSTAALANAPLLAGQSLQTRGEESSAVILYADGTRLALGADSTVSLFSANDSNESSQAAAGKRVVLSEGFLTADVAPQPAGQPMVLTTPQAELVVLGTRFNLSGGSEATYVETDEGSVRVTRKSDGQSVQVDGGFATSVTAAAPLVAQSLPKTLAGPRLALDSFWTASLSPDGRTLAATSYLEGNVELRDVSTGQIQHAFAAHRKRILAVAFSRDSATLATGSSDGTIKLWDRVTAQLQATLDPQAGWVSDLAFSADNATLVAVSAAEGSEERVVTVLDLVTREPRPAPLHVTAKVLALAPDGKLLATANRQKKSITLWDVESGREKIVLGGVFQNVFSLAFSADGTILVVDSASGIVGLWDTATGRLRDGLERRGGRIFGMAFSSDGRLLATGHQDGTVRLTELTSQEELAVSAATPLVHARALSFATDGQSLLTREIRLATGDRRRDGAVYLWDLPPEVFRNEDNP
jgi:WD40 repeat protein